MVTKQGPRVGVIADSSLQRHVVCRALQSFGYEVAAALPPDRVDDAMLRQASADAWVVDLEDEDRWLDFLAGLLESAEVPILFGQGRAPTTTSRQYPAWQRRIYSKVKDLVGQPPAALETLTPDLINDKRSPPAAIPLPRELARAVPAGDPARYIWVIGASLGGPAAVKTFLDALPDGLPLAFIIAQHIDAGFQKTLAQVLGRHNRFHFIEVVEGMTLQAGDVLIAPVEQVVSVDPQARIRFHSGEWEGPYAPSIDQVMESSARQLGERTGAILFSGMGNDGSIAASRMHARGIPVWAQSAETCACSSQPDSARATGGVSFSGSPHELALHLTQYAKQHYASLTTL